jgi:hypothetical protein
LNRLLLARKRFSVKTRRRRLEVRQLAAALCSSHEGGSKLPHSEGFAPDNKCAALLICLTNESLTAKVLGSASQGGGFSWH